MKKILFIDNQQFGSLTDSFKYCEILKDKYDITYLCFDKGLEKQSIKGVKVKYVSYSGNKSLRGIRFLLRAIFEAGIFHGFIFVIYFEKFQLIKRALPWKKMHVDIRTLCVNKDEKIRKRIDCKIKEAIEVFDTASAISQGVIDKIGSGKKIYLLPLGADAISSSNKRFDNLRLLYVGTLNNRDIIKTVKGFKKYIDLFPTMDVKYDIVGDGEEYNDIVEYIANENIGELVKCHGRVPHSQLGQYFDRCNIGVSFVPMTDYYENQPPTKTFEYAFSGMFTIATRTQANQEIITPQTGLLIGDNSDDFAQSLDVIWKNRDDINSIIIRKSVENYSWENIVNQYLEPIIQGV